MLPCFRGSPARRVGLGAEKRGGGSYRGGSQELYTDGGPGPESLAEQRPTGKELADEYNRTGSREDDARQRILSQLLGSVGSRVWIEPLLRVAYDARWVKAERSAEGVVDHRPGDALRYYFTRLFPLGATVVVVLVVRVSAALPGPISWADTFLIGTFLGGMLAAIGGVVYSTKYVQPRLRLSSIPEVLLPLEKDERILVLREAAGKEPLRPGHARIARAAAVQMRSKAAWLLVVAPAYVLILGPVGRPGSWWSMAVFAMMVALNVAQGVDFRRRGRFLEETAGHASTFR